MSFFMSSAAEAELGALYPTTKEMVTLEQTLIQMGWPAMHSYLDKQLHCRWHHQPHHCTTKN
jgi:hypothetical protein